MVFGTQAEQTRLLKLKAASGWEAAKSDKVVSEVLRALLVLWPHAQGEAQPCPEPPTLPRAMAVLQTGSPTALADKLMLSWLPTGSKVRLQSGLLIALGGGAVFPLALITLAPQVLLSQLP